MTPEKQFMEAAIEEAKKAAKIGDYPIGTVIVRGKVIIGRGRDKTISKNDPTLHAGVVAIQDAVQRIGNRYLEDCVMYKTHEACPMCAAAVIWAKMKSVVIGARNVDITKWAAKKQGTFSWRIIPISCKDILSKGTPQPELIEGFMRDACCELFQLSK